MLPVTGPDPGPMTLKLTPIDQRNSAGLGNLIPAAVRVFATTEARDRRGFVHRIISRASGAVCSFR
jgi:hypothetical protein